MVGFEGGSKNSDQNNLEQEDDFNACLLQGVSSLYSEEKDCKVCQ